MNAKPVLARVPLRIRLVVAGLATIFAVLFLSAVAVLFESTGAPYEQVVVAERACADRAYVSERETCIRARLAASRLQNVASR